MVNDGSTDGSWELIKEMAKTNSHIKGICFRKNYGKSAALFHGFEAADGEVVITMDADLQDDPREIPALYDMIMKDGYDLVSGWKKKRYDSKLTKNLPSKLYNATARKVTGIKLHDMNCGLKAYRNIVVKNIEVYGEMHRYIPYLAKNAGFGNIGEKVVHHQARKYGVSKFGMDRFVNGFLDLISLWFLSRFGKKPMHFFGLMGTLTFLVGAVISVWVIVEKVVAQSQGLKFRAVTDQPLFYLALVALLIGVQLFLTGFIAELVSRNSQERNTYNIKERF
jgi:glycosyltransferase involved in cell wall biosynthesis